MEARRNVCPENICLLPVVCNFLLFGDFLVDLVLRGEHTFRGVDPLLSGLPHPEWRGPVFYKGLLDPPPGDRITPRGAESIQTITWATRSSGYCRIQRWIPGVGMFWLLSKVERNNWRAVADAKVKILAIRDGMITLTTCAVRRAEWDIKTHATS